MEPFDELDEPIMLQCMVPKKGKLAGLEATDFHRKSPWSSFCHVRFTRPMFEGDSLELKIEFHDVPRAEGQMLLSITPSGLRYSKAKKIIDKNPFVVDPLHAWMGHLANEDPVRECQFGLRYNKGAIQLRLPNDSEFFSIYHIPADNDIICIDIFFCQNIKSVCLQDTLETEQSNGEITMIYPQKSHVLIV